MKKTLLFLSVILMIGCSKTPQQKVEKSVEKYLTKTEKLTDYQPTSFNNFKIVKLNDIDKYIVANDSLRYYKSELNKMGDQFKMAAMQRGAKRMKYEIKTLEILYKKVNYAIEHTYSYKESNGNLVKDTTKTFYLTHTFKVLK